MTNIFRIQSGHGRRNYVQRLYHAFTLVELLVVISIIALLLAILMPSLQKARKSAQGVVCQSNTKQMGLALALYTGANNGALPPYGDWAKVVDSTATVADTWMGYILPLIGAKLDLNKTTNAPVLICPARRQQVADNKIDKANNSIHIIDYGVAYGCTSDGGGLFNYINVQGHPESRSATLTEVRSPSRILAIMDTVKWKYKSSPVVYNMDTVYQPFDKIYPLGNLRWKITDLTGDSFDSDGDGILDSSNSGKSNSYKLAYKLNGKDDIPTNYSDHSRHARGKTKGGTNAVFVDGHAEFVPTVEWRKAEHWYH